MSNEEHSIVWLMVEFSRRGCECCKSLNFCQCDLAGSLRYENNFLYVLRLRGSYDIGCALPIRRRKGVRTA